MKTLTVLLFFISQLTFSQYKEVKVDGTFKKWQKVTLSFTGDTFNESQEVNPYLNYRLNVVFKHKNKTYIVPGFYAADGNAAETSAKTGKVWQVRFMPDEVGTWTYQVSFRKGENIAVNDDINAGEPVAFDALKGDFEITNPDEGDKGRLQYTGDRYLHYAETNTPFLKGGTDSPENFLGYYEFDQTPDKHRYEPHAQDWRKGDPTWQNGKGKNIIGALNYLASKGMNSVYFLTMNVQGDGKDVWPWTDENERYRFDCSKLDQWELVFDHMDALGLMLHIVTQETENELLMDIGELGVQRKLYYRELIARFSHHLAITWNLGEENGPVHWSPKGQNDSDRKAMAKYLKTHDPYKNLVVLHTHSLPEEQDLYLNPLLGYPFLDGPSIQTHKPDLIHDITKNWINESQKNGRNWVVNQDEIGPADTGAKPDKDDPNHDDIRHRVLWANLMAGGAGVEWYFGYKFDHNDLNCEDWRSRDGVWNQTRYALDFFQNYLPFSEMQSADGLTDNPNDFVFAKNDDTYAIYLPEVKETKINLFGSKNTFQVKWYNPRTGGDLQNGSVKTIEGGQKADIGFPPNKEKDWVALLSLKRKTKKGALNTKKEVVTLNALTDFEIETNQNKAVYYKDKSNGVFAINAADKAQRSKYAYATTRFNGVSGLYDLAFISMAENDGESEYLILKNGSVISEVTNPETDKTFAEARYNLGRFFIAEHDIIQIASKAVTNKKIPENDETAWSRGRWSRLVLTPEGMVTNEMLQAETAFTEKDGVLEIEAENFHYNSKNGTNRTWIIKTAKEKTDQSKTASSNTYIEAFPDTRVTHDDVLITGDNFFPLPGIGGLVSYKINVSTAGRYYVWVSAYSNGTEDNGVHVGINNTWPESGARMQWCEGKNKWTWSSAQRDPDNHCGTPKTIFLDLEEGTSILSFSMREDGFKMDRIILTKDINFSPK
ncbi:DUF5060 domain-containing protein [Algibacter amylolyticus]|uniref:DUF5060 domain-containing protein n=1 Tax=Algibacter amylolyticus TaxID=1608400 RepID=A0A5M7BAL2_9FLAO|nr:DUF5060 domain-containing protein [Algibacter amylolyticus]KAA5826432.1 DUF5060 domain-containing protein [Algibacter amylolyticus]MBB5268641.1 hypothetical protein [Algibacter amylolyticus]TSJ80470.1 DUF5060 domain-containing protein [Algibacter amylolyticus]